MKKPKKPLVLTVANRKGGVGKTTSVHILAPYFATVLGLRTVIFDFDEQANITRRYCSVETNGDHCHAARHPDYEEIVAEDPAFTGSSSSTDLFFGNPIYPYPTDIENLEILPANTAQIEQLNNVSGNEKDTVATLLYEFFKRDDVAEMEWDIILIDTPPSSISPLTRSAIRASTHCLIPTEMEKMAIEGLVGVITAINKENREKTEDTTVIGILPTSMQKNQSVHMSIYKTLCEHESFGKYMIKYPAWNRSDILKLSIPEMYSKEVSAATPWDGSCFSKKNRDEVELWCSFVAKSMGFKPRLTPNKKQEFVLA